MEKLNTNLSVAILTKNEKENIREAILDLSFVDEVVVVDDFSTDGTDDLATKLGAAVYKRSLDGNFAEQRNFALQKAKGKWVLFLDADERVTPHLRDEIIQVVNNPLLNVSGYFIKREDVLWGQKMKGGEFGKTWLLRLARKTAGKWTRNVHETWNINGKTEKLRYPIVHKPHTNLSSFIESVNQNSTLHANQNKLESKKANIIKIIFWPKMKFIKNLFFLGAARDGMVGFVASLMMSLHSFLAWSKQYLNQKTK